jgi:uncharacterized protein YqjF (DUF2071 family)
MAQRWHDLLFAHWPIPVEVMRPLVPAALPIDTFDGQAWLGVVPFRMSGIRLRGMPGLPRLSAFAELNVRTYTVIDGKPGVYFFSLDAASLVAVRTARRWYQLPYYLAAMRCEQRGESIVYDSRRIDPAGVPAEFIGRYRPVGEAIRSEPGSLEHWLTERYCLYTADARGRVRRAEILHEPWPLQPATAELSWNTMALAAGIALPDTPPNLWFSRSLDVVIWHPRLVPT